VRASFKKQRVGAMIEKDSKEVLLMFCMWVIFFGFGIAIDLPPNLGVFSYLLECSQDCGYYLRGDNYGIKI